MKHAKGLAVVGGVVALLVAGYWITNSVIPAIKRVNEPDPTTIPLELVQRVFAAQGIKSRVEKVVYVNRDSMDYIVQGKIEKLDEHLWRSSRGIWLREPSGLLRAKTVGKATFLLFSNYTRSDEVGSSLQERWDTAGH